MDPPVPAPTGLVLIFWQRGKAASRPSGFTAGRSADALGRQVYDLGSLFLGDQVRAGRYVAARHQAVLGVERQEGDRQIALEVLLLIDGESRLAVNDRLQEACRHVEGADVDL